jgi:type I restriction enzyme S subunit
MNCDWPLKDLESVADEVTVGYVGSMATEYVDSGVPFLRSLNIERFKINERDLKYVSQEFHTRIKKSVLRSGDVAIVRTGKPGTCAVIPKWLGEANCSDLVIVRCGRHLRPEFLCYWVNSMASHHISSHTVGAVQQHFNVGAAKKMKVAVPSLYLQDQVTAMLGALDERIALLLETNATLEAIAQALFKSWFVDFDPVRAKEEGRVPEGMDDMTAALFPDSFDESKIGPVPKGWGVTALADAFDINPKRSLKKAVSAPYLDMASLGTSGHCVEAPIQRDMGSGAKYRNGDTLLARITPCLENGKSAFVDFLDDEQVGWGSTEFLVLRPKPPLPEYFGYLLCRHPAFRDYAIQSMSGTSGRQRVQNDVLGRYLLPVADENVASAFSGIVEALQKSITANHEKARSLAAIRNELLPRLISGQLRQPDAAEMVVQLKTGT